MSQRPECEELQKSVQKLRERQFDYEQLITIIGAIPGGIYLVTEQYDIDYINPMVEREFGHVEGHKCYEYFHNRTSPCPWCKFPDVLAGKSVQWEWYSQKNDRHYLLFDTPFKNADGSISKLEFFRDITDCKEVERKLVQAQKFEALGTMASGISHDFNNILTVILGHLTLAKEEILAPETLKTRIHKVIHATNRAKDLVKQILLTSRQKNENIQPVKIQCVLEETLQLLQVTLPANIQIKQNINIECQAVLADPVQLHQIIMNLGTNAYHAMKDTRGVLSVSLKPCSPQSSIGTQPLKIHTNEFLQLQISDTGSGIAQSHLSKIFDPYFTTKDMGEGTGLGLSIVQRIVMKNGGNIKVESKPGKGTIFTIYWPAISTSIA